MPPEMNQGNGDREWSLQDYIDLFLRRKLIIFSIFAAVFAATLWYTLMRPPKYHSSATLLIESPNMGLGSLLGNQRNYGMEEYGRPIEFYEALLQSQAYQDLLFQQLLNDSLIVASGVTTEQLERIRDKELTLSTAEKTDLVYLGVTAGSPQLAWRFASIATEVFKVRCRQIELEETRNVVDYVEKQKDISRSKLEDAERALQKFNESSSIAVSDEEGGLLKKLVELEGQLAEVQSQRQLAEANIAAYNQRLSDLKAPNTPELNTVDTPATKALRSRLDQLVEERSRLSASGQRGVRAVALDQEIDEVRNQLYRAIIETRPAKDAGAYLNQNLWEEIRQNRVKEELQLYMLRNRERFFQRQVETYRRENPKLIERAIEMTRLQRSKKVYEDMFSILLEKGEEARIKSATSTGGIRIIDWPTIPQNPVPVHMPRNLLIGALLGLGLGFGFAMMLEYLDNTIRSGDELTRHTGLSILAAVPAIEPRDSKNLAAKLNPATVLSDGADEEYSKYLIHKLPPRDPVVDVYRSLRTNLQFAGVDKPITAMLVSSSLPGEGKTLTAANLAISYAELGKRVLLVDGDLRKPKQHLVFGVEASAGLSDFMVKSLDLKQILYPTTVPNLRLAPCGTVPPNPAEMIASRRMSDFLQHMQKLFDLVIIDSPPVRVVADPLLFAGKVSHALLVVKFASTQLRDVQEAVALLRRAKTPLLGAVFNHINLGRGHGYYGRYNYYYYAESAGKKR